MTAVFLSSTAWAQLPSLSFPTPKIDVPAIPLLDRAKERAGKPMDDAAQWFRNAAAKPAPKTERYVSGMPIVRPRESIDPKMVHTPRTDIDFKMIVKTPAMAMGAEVQGPRPLGDAKHRAQESARRKTP